MGRRKNSLPKLQLHKASRNYKVRIGNKDFYLGKNKNQAVEQYNALILKTLSDSKNSNTDAGHPFSVGDLAAEYCLWADRRFRKNGRSTGQPDRIRLSLRPFLELHCGEPVDSIHVRDIVCLRTQLVDHARRRTKSGDWIALSRSTVNQRIGVILSCFKWGVTQGLVKPEVYGALSVIQPLGPRESNAREPVIIHAVPDLDLQETLLELDQSNPMVADMVRLQVRTGLRSTELCSLRPVDIDRSQRCWEYRVADHKTSDWVTGKTVPFGPECQRILGRYLESLGPTEYCFSPARAAQKSRLQKKRAPGLRYTKDSYRRAVQRAAQRAGVPLWHPHQLRHNAATAIEREFGQEAARNILGHTDSQMTTRYIDYNRPLAQAVAEKLG